MYPSSTQYRQTDKGYKGGPPIIDRPRLLAKLDGILDHRLTLISAPPGYGKTTLISQFAKRSAYPVVWQTIDERQRDVSNLHSQCLTTLAQLLPGIRILDAHRGYAGGELAVLIADFLRDNLKTDTLYVLDDVQHLANAPAAEAWLRTLVSLAPPLCHLVLVSRFLPNLPLAEFIARREVLAIGQEELRLNSDEIRALGEITLGARPADETVHRLLDNLEGWPAGTVLALQPLPPDFERALLNGQTGPEALFNALAKPMIYSQPPEVQDFLLASSTLTRMTPELCINALGLSNSADLLLDVQTRNLFVAHLASGLLYHTLFRDLLQTELKETNLAQYTGLHSRAAHYFEDNDYLEEAFYHHTEADDLASAADIANRVLVAFAAQGKTETLLAWNARLLEANQYVPRLLLRCAIIYTDRYQYDKALANLDHAEATFAEQHDESGLANIQLQRAILNLQQGNYQAAIALATPLVRLPPGNDNVPGRALNVLGSAHLLTGQAAQSALLLEQALPLYRAHGDAYAQSHVLQSLAATYWRLGRLSESLARLQEVVAFRRSLGGAEQLAVALNNLGYYYCQFGEYTHAAATLQEALSTIGRSPNPRVETYLLQNLGDIQRNRGAFDDALQLYHKALELLGDREPILQCSILMSLTTLHRWQSKPEQAIALAEKALEIATKHNAQMPLNTATLGLWVAYAQLGQAEQGLARLKSVVERLEAQHEEHALLQALGLLAHAAILAGQRTEASHYLDLAVELADKIGTTQPLLCEVQYSPRLEAFITKNAAHYSQLISDLHRLRRMQVPPPSALQRSELIHGATNGAGLRTFSLRILTLGQDKVSRDGIPVTSREWRPVARQLFLYLLFEGPQDRNAIALMFWPDKPYRTTRRDFHNALYYTRRTLGENVIAFQEDRYQIAPDIDIWCDALELLNLTAQARLLSPHDARTEDLWLRAANLYNGEFLPNLDAEWIERYRDALHEAYIDALIGIADCARARGDLREALRRYKHVLTLEPYREDIHCAIMTCYASRGTKQKVLAQMHDLQKLLQTDLGAEPSAETWAIYKHLLT